MLGDAPGPAALINESTDYDDAGQLVIDHHKSQQGYIGKELWVCGLVFIVYRRTDRTVPWIELMLFFGNE